MCNIHQLFKTQVEPSVSPASALRPFAVSFRFAGQLHELNVLAFTSCDATCNAIDIFFDGSDEMPAGGLDIKVRPLNILPRAA